MERYHIIKDNVLLNVVEYSKKPDGTPPGFPPGAVAVREADSVLAPLPIGDQASPMPLPTYKASWQTQLVNAAFTVLAALGPISSVSFVDPADRKTWNVTYITEPTAEQSTAISAKIDEIVNSAKGT